MNTGSLPIGTILRSPKNDYRVEAVLGHGGFGITYRVSTKRSVKVEHVSQTVRLNFAVKEFFPKGCDRAGDGQTMTFASTLATEVKQSLSDFITEARRLYQLDTLSEHIVKVNEVFEANDTAYYVMEYLDGGSLEDYVAQHGPLSWDEARRILAPVAHAVAGLHSERLLHMDIKPDNIVFKLTDDDRRIPVLIDFGIAKHFDAEGHPTSHLTAKGASDGYAPAEQYVGITSFAPEIDVYALGATLYFLLTGKRPPSAADIRTVDDLVQALPTAAAPAVPLLKCAMQPSRFYRLSSAADFARMLSGEAPAPVQPEPVEEDASKTLKLGDSPKKALPASPKAKVQNEPASKAQDPTLSLTPPATPPSTPSSEESAPSDRRGVRIVLLIVFVLLLGVYFSILLFCGSHSQVGSADSVTEEAEEVTVVDGEIVPFTVNGVTFNMVKVSGGTFMMGTTNFGTGNLDIYEASLSSYCIGQTEVTQALWKAVMGKNPSYFKGDNLPVDEVTLNQDDCQTFISKLNELTGQSFRLPSEEEWVFAALGGNKGHGYKYSGSNNINDVAWYKDNGDERTHEVATKAPNELGLYDMTGNVVELCTSNSGYNGYYDRGGAWCDIPDDIALPRDSQGNLCPAYTDGTSGLRLVLDITQ